VATDRGPASGSADATGARAVALRVIRRVTEEHAYSSLALGAELRRSGLSDRDRGLAAELAYGTLRRMLWLDRAVDAVSTRPVGDIDPGPLAVLRLGAYQLLETRIPAHAAVSETVGLAEGRSRGFVNAVLRRLSVEPPEPPSGDGDDAISARTGLTPWAVAELRQVLPGGEVERAAAAMAARAPLSLRVHRCRTTPAHVEQRLRSAGHDPRRGLHHPDVFLLESGAGSPVGLPGFDEGWFVVQDEASALVAAALGVVPGERVLDACAGPGGKATDLACRAGPGALIVAADVNLRRTALVARTANRLGVGLHTLVQDARRPALRGGFDAVLVDAPCSGLGAARRRPELLWRPRREDLAGLARLQVAILMGAASLVRPGGRLVYSVCTVPRAETEAAVRAFLTKSADFAPSDVPGPDGLAPTHRLWPHRHGTDAMFYAGFRRGGEGHG
jgi:16S rRNA (cytosine967-C5)-methyltransferase